jgi:hypothetical protein
VWKSCGRIVETLWTGRHENKLSARCWPKSADRISRGRSFVPSFACFATACVPKSDLAFDLSLSAAASPENIVSAHCFEEHIAGRTYRIEVLPVSDTRWRAQIARLPGMPTSLMPFYGPTPELAARELSRWLALVYNGVTTQ